MLVGLAAKNAILIVEFAWQFEESGKPRFGATVEACRLRLRPILMTSFAFILGAVTLVLATGAGWEMRYTPGSAVFSGMPGLQWLLSGACVTMVLMHRLSPPPLWIH